MSARKAAAYGTGEVADMRLINDAIARAAETLHHNDVPFEFYCECGAPGCDQVAQLTLEEYRTRPPRILVAHPQVA